ncbi:MAG: hypothetical protein Q8N23_12935 [Archangium sp.]|nr:hypothetical protein [Archangium sp.]MDP3574502.1 hypothetical protein [Archangium sp.]
MPRLLKRLSLAFAVFAIGLVLFAFIALRVVAQRVIADDTEPVRRQLTADWEKNAATLEAQLAAAAAWNTPGEPTPPALGCQLRWTGESAAVQRHLERCPDAPGPIDEKTLAALDTLGEQLLWRAADAPVVERDFGWMADLQGRDDWGEVAGTPLEFFEVHSAIVEAPTLALRQVRGLALLRLLQGHRAGTLEAAVTDVTALAKALVGRPFVLDQLVGVGILDRQRAVLDALGRKELGPPSQAVQALRGARLASAMLWHPWVPQAQRDRFVPKLPVASRCAAASEALLLMELGPLLAENHADFVNRFTAWRSTTPCPSTFVKAALTARAVMPEDSWKKLLGSAQFIDRAEQGEFFSALLVRVVESTALGRRAVTELILSLTAAKPFPADSEQSR